MWYLDSRLDLKATESAKDQCSFHFVKFCVEQYLPFSFGKVQDVDLI